MSWRIDAHSITSRSRSALCFSASSSQRRKQRMVWRSMTPSISPVASRSAARLAISAGVSTSVVGLKRVAHVQSLAPSASATRLAHGLDLIVGHRREEWQRQRALGDLLGDGKLAALKAEALAVVRHQVDARQIRLGGDAALGEVGDHGLAVVALRHPHGVDEPAPPLGAAVGAGQDEAVRIALAGGGAADRAQALGVRGGHARARARAAHPPSRPARCRARPGRRSCGS